VRKQKNKNKQNNPKKSMGTDEQTNKKQTNKKLQVQDH
jgi:hypothetical protein